MAGLIVGMLLGEDNNTFFKMAGGASVFLGSLLPGAAAYAAAQARQGVTHWDWGPSACSRNPRSWCLPCARF